MIQITHGKERANVCEPEEGCTGIDFKRHVPGFGYDACDDPSFLIRRLALAVRREMYPAAPIVTADDLEALYCRPLEEITGRDDERDTEADPFRLEML